MTNKEIWKRMNRKERVAMVAILLWVASLFATLTCDLFGFTILSYIFGVGFGFLWLVPFVLD